MTYANMIWKLVEKLLEKEQNEETNEQNEETNEQNEKQED
jgi:hypothetical protein